MKRFGRRLIAAIVASSLIVTPVLATPSSKELKEKQKSLESEKKQTQAEVNSLQAELKEIIQKIDELELDLIEKGEEIIQAQEDLEEAEEQERQQYADMKLRIQFMYEEGDSSLVETLISAESFTDLMNKAEYVQNVHQYDREKLEEYVATKERIAALKKQLEEEQAEMEALEAEYEEQEEEMDALIASKQAEIEDLDEQIAEAAEAAAEAAAQEAAAAAAARAAEAANSGNASSDSSAADLSATTYTGTGNTSTASKIVSAAYSQLGVPYVWGGTTPGKALDCSGLTQYCLRCAGISVAHYSGSQGAGGQRVSNPQPGDLVCYSGHVGVYIGGGQMIHAPHTGTVVQVASVYGSPWYVRYW